MEWKGDWMQRGRGEDVLHYTDKVVSTKRSVKQTRGLRKNVVANAVELNLKYIITIPKMACNNWIQQWVCCRWNDY
jgi:hypothetical protein